MDKEELIKQWGNRESEELEEEFYKIEKHYESLYDVLKLSNKYYEEIISSTGEHDDEVRSIVSEIANKLASFSVKNNVILGIKVKQCRQEKI